MMTKKLSEAEKLMRKTSKVVQIENDGDFIRAKFVRMNGEVVVGIYKRVGWALPPAIEAAEFREIFIAAPRLIFR
jgi:hypothetical protein